MDGWGGWGLRAVLARGRRQTAILGVVLAVCLLAATLLSALALMVDSARRHGVHAALTAADPAEATVHLDLTLGNSGTVAAAQARSEASMGRLFAGLPRRSTVRMESTLSSVRSPKPVVPSAWGWMVYYTYADGLTGSTPLVAGHWPTPADAAGAVPAGGGHLVPVALPETVASTFHLAVGSRFAAADLERSDRPTTAVVTGVFRMPDGTHPPGWDEDRLNGKGVAEHYKVPYVPGPFAYGALYGPLVTTREAFTSGDLVTWEFWRVEHPDLAALPVPALHDTLTRLRDAPRDVRVDLLSGPSGVVQGAGVTTGLVPVLDRAERFLLVTEGTVAVVALQLLVLSVAALLLGARLLAERRLTEQSLLRARGASTAQLLRLAATEALLLAAVVVVAAPQLARPAYRAVVRLSGLDRSGMDVDPGSPPIAWAAAGAVGLLFVAVLVAPLLRRGTATFVESEQAAARPARTLQRSGVDLAVLALAALAYTQLRSYRSPLVGSGGSVHADPVLVAGPALTLLGGALVTVRIVPAASRLLERVADRGRSLVTPLAAWEVGRRSRRAVGAVLLLTLALAVGTFGLSFLATWRASQLDQADVRVGADARIAADVRRPALEESALVASVPGASVVAPGTLGPALVQVGVTARPELDVADGTPVQALAVDARRAAVVLRGRTLDGGQDNAGARARLAALGGAAPVTGVPLPATARTLRLRAVATGAAPMQLVGTVAAVVQDGAGVRQVVRLGEVRTTGVPVQLHGDLVRPGMHAVPPLSVVAVQTRWTATDDSPGPPLGPVPDSPGDQFRVAPPPVTLTLDAAATLDDGGRPTDLAVPARTGVDGWSTVLERQDGASVTVGDGPLLRARFTPSLDGVDGQERVAYGVVTFTSWTPGTEPVPALAGGSLLDDTEAGTGSTLVLPVGDATVDVELTGSVRYLPGLDPASAQLVVDADRLGRRVIELGGAPPPPTDWWVGVPDGRADAYAADLTARGAGTVRTAHGTARALLEQPLRLSIGGVLWLVVAGAAAFAAVGFAVHTTVAVRLRRVEFAQLQALGATRRALDAVVVVENLLLVGLGTLAGTGLGVLLGRLVSPLVALTAEGNAPLPGVVVHLPWGQVLLLVAGIGAVLAVTLAVVLRVLRTGGPGGILRLGDER